MYSKNKHKHAIKLRNEGKSLKDIADSLGVAKSTASYWLTGYANKGAFGNMTRQEWLNSIREQSLKVRQERSIIKKEKYYLDAKSQVTSYKPSVNTKKALLSLLYWAEGGKGYKDLVSFANTDPLLIKLFLQLLRESYPINESKLRVRLHLHKYHDGEKAVTYWSELTHIPPSQFGKLFWKKEPNSGKRYRQNFQGICFVRYNSVELQREITAFAHALGVQLTKK